MLGSALNQQWQELQRRWILTATNKTRLNRGIWHIPATLLCWQAKPWWNTKISWLNDTQKQQASQKSQDVGLSWFLISYGFSYHFYPFLIFHDSIITHLAIVFNIWEIVSFLEHNERRAILSRRLLSALPLPCLPGDPSGHWNNPQEAT